MWRDKSIALDSCSSMAGKELHSYSMFLCRTREARVGSHEPGIGDLRDRQMQGIQSTQWGLAIEEPVARLLEMH